MHVPISSYAARKCERRRVVALAYGVAPARAYEATIAMPQAARPREPVRAVGLTVFAVHAAIVVALWHAWVPDRRPALPRALAVEVDASEFAQAAESGVHSWRDVATHVPPERTPSRSSRDTVVHRETRPTVVATRQIDHAVSSRKSAGAIAAAQPDGERPVPEREPVQPAAAHAAADTATMPARAMPAERSSAAAEPVTAPRFAAAYLHNPAPDYPDIAQRRGWEGTTFLNVHVLANGRADQVLLSASSGHDALDDAAVAAVTDWRFVPAKRGAESTDGWVRVPVVFKLGN